MLALDQRDVFAEFLAVQLDQPAPVHVLLARHVGEHLGGGGIVGAQPLGEVEVDAAVLLLGGNRQRQDFALAQLVEITHASGPSMTVKAGRWVPARMKWVRSA